MVKYTSSSSSATSTKSEEVEASYFTSPLDEFEKNVFTCLPSYGTGTFTLSTKKIHEGFFRSPLFEDWDAIDSDKPDKYYTYKYKTRYSREEESHIKIDEYTLKRNVVEQSQWAKEKEKREKKRKKKEEKKKKKNNMWRENKYISVYTKKKPNKYYTTYLQVSSSEDERNIFNTGINSDTDFITDSDSDTDSDTDADALWEYDKEDEFYKCIFTETPKTQKKKKKKKEKKNLYLDKRNSKNGFTKRNFSEYRYSKMDFKNYSKDFLKRSSTGYLKSFANINPDPTLPHHTNLPYTLRYDSDEDTKLTIESYRIVSAPNLKDDFYYSVLDWSSKNMIAVGLESSLCLWDNNTGRSHDLFVLNPMKPKDLTKKLKKQHVTSVKWNKLGTLLAVGLSTGAVDIWDIVRKVKIRKYKNHKSRVGALSWKGNVLTSGSKDTIIINCDLRLKENNIIELKKHTLEVCGLQWSPNEQQLASGSNDSSLYIWDYRKNEPLFHFDKHKATVKALAWSPHQPNMLISGGGCVDKNIFFWNTLKGTCFNKIHTNSQVCALLWSKNTKEFLSTHSSLHSQIIMWKYPKLKKKAVLSEHGKRVLHLALSPDGSTFISASPDETIQFWEVFPKQNDSPYFDIWNNPNDFIGGFGNGTLETNSRKKIRVIENTPQRCSKKDTHNETYNTKNS